MSEDSEIIKEFLVESHENLDQLDRDFVALESDPGARERLAAIFRTIHTIKGTSGFMGFHQLEAVTHAGEHLLSRLRDSKLVLDAEITSELLRMVDAVRGMLANIEALGTDGEHRHEELVARLTELAARGDSPAREPLPAAGLASTPVPHTAPAASTFAAPPPAHAPPRAPSAVITFATVAPDAGASTRPLATSRAHMDPLPAASSLPDPGGTLDTHVSVSDSSVRVDVGLLDKLMNLVGELVLARNQIVQHANTLSDAAFQSTTQRLNIITTELQEGVMKTRMQPIGSIWGKFPRVVRDLAMTCKKQVQIEMLGEDTELDRTILEAIKDPLTHLVRNSVDHGIEPRELRISRGKAPTGKLLMRAFHESGQVNIEISDDGAGIDPERIRQHAVQRGVLSAEHARSLTDREILNVIFAPGFSTAERVTNVSGRGVGMDVVKTNIEKIGGTIDIHSRVGHGTKFKIKIPLTLAIIPALVITSGGERFAIPQVSLLELVRLEGAQIGKQIEHIHGAPVYRLRGNLLPLVHLSHTLNLPDLNADSDVVNIVVVRADDRQFGLVVDGVNDTEEIVVKPLGRELKGISVFAGATIMGDGRVALILDVLGLAQRTGVIPEVRDRGLGERTREVAAHEECEPLLLFQVTEKGRIAMPLALVARLEEIQAATIEWAGGNPVIQYRGEILRLIDLREVLGGQSPAAISNGPLQVVVYSEQGRSIGLVVDQILDIVDEVIGVKHRSAQPGISSAAVIQGRVTDILDAHGIVEATHPGFFDAGRAA
jgi:two-component system chemotaxis sensor kinase CheA